MINKKQLKRKFKVDYGVIQEVLKFNKKDELRLALIKELLEKSYMLQIQSGYTQDEILKNYDSSKDNKTLIEEGLSSVKNRLLERSKTNKKLSESFTREKDYKINILEEYFIKPPKVENGEVALSKLIVKHLIDSIVDLDC